MKSASLKQKIITLTGVTKKFEGKKAVNCISFQVCKGEIFALLGPNGAGKSTAIRLITTLIQPDEGLVEVDGYDVVDKPDQVRKRIGVVFQNSSLDDELTVVENLMLHALMYSMGGKEAALRIDIVLRLMDLLDYRKMITKNLSGGLKRRVEIARALLHKPSILFLDEPTLGLDTQTRVSMWQHLRSLSKNENVTIVFTTHYLEEVEEFSDNVSLIDNGAIVASGSVDEVKGLVKATTLQEAYLKLTGNNPRA